jgi:hypothetical protein
MRDGSGIKGEKVEVGGKHKRSEDVEVDAEKDPKKVKGGNGKG